MLDEENKHIEQHNSRKRAREHRINEMLNSEGTYITKKSKLLIENTIDKNRKERIETENKLKQQAEIRLAQNSFTTIPITLNRILPATSSIRSRFNFGRNSTRMTSVTLFDINATTTPKPNKPKTNEPNEPTEEEILNHSIATITQLPEDDFDNENPFGHNLGMDDDNEPTASYTNAQLAGPPDVVWLTAEEQGCFRHTD